jgi:two-component sensor histidine kinase
MDATVASARPPGPWQTTLPGKPVSVQAARRFVRDALACCPRAADLVLAVSELATNAVAWSAAGEHGTFTVTVRTAPRWARIEVTDPGPATAPAAESNGWGLDIVRAITDRAGTDDGPGSSHTTWAEITWPAAGTPDRRPRA